MYPFKNFYFEQGDTNLYPLESKIKKVDNTTVRMRKWEDNSALWVGF